MHLFACDDCCKALACKGCCGLVWLLCCSVASDLLEHRSFLSADVVLGAYANGATLRVCGCTPLQSTVYRPDHSQHSESLCYCIVLPLLYSITCCELANGATQHSTRCGPHSDCHSCCPLLQTPLPSGYPPFPPAKWLCLPDREVQAVTLHMPISFEAHVDTSEWCCR